MNNSNAELNSRLVRLEYLVEQLSQRIDEVDANLQRLKINLVIQGGT